MAITDLEPGRAAAARTGDTCRLRDRVEAAAWWRDHGRAIRDGMLWAAKGIANRHVRMTDRDGLYPAHGLTYGAPFLGPHSHVAGGDRAIGADHALSTPARPCLRRRMIEGLAGHAEQAQIRVRRHAGDAIRYGKAAR
ncbi:hypothetical protein ACNKFW_01580 [Paracoccus sp. TD-10]|uniref:hypothetical protein n=1 Tax=Paracoccus sp. TD-10 TaxID=3395918 RepID=UPI003AB01BFB